MEYLNSARKKTEQLIDKTSMGISGAIYTTGSAFEKGGTKVGSFLTSSAGAVGGAVGDLGSGIYDQCCSLAGVAGTTTEVNAALKSGEAAMDEGDIMKADQDQGHKITEETLGELEKVTAGERLVGVCNKSDIQLFDKMLPLRGRDDKRWKEAKPLGKITESLYPFGDTRPTPDELDQAYKVALRVMMDPVNAEYKARLEPYIIQMFGKPLERHEAIRAEVGAEKLPKQFSLQVKLMNGKNLISRDANGKSDPYCYLSIIKKEHRDIVASSKPNLPKLHETKDIGYDVVRSKVIVKTLHPVWNESFTLPMRGSPCDMLVIEVWDSDDDSVKLKDVKFSKIGRFFKDFGEADDFMGRAFLPLSGIGLSHKEVVLPLYSRNQKKQLGEVTVQLNMVGKQLSDDNTKLLSDYSKLCAAVLDFESYMTGEYVAGWNAQVSVLGYDLLALNAAMCGITALQQVSVLFPLLQSFDKRVDMSIIGYFSILKVINENQEQLPSLSFGSRAEMNRNESTLPEWMKIIFECLKKLDDSVMGVLRRHHYIFDFKKPDQVEYLALHLHLVTELYTIVPHVERLEDTKKNIRDVVSNACQNACHHWFTVVVQRSLPLSSVQTPGAGASAENDYVFVAHSQDAVDERLSRFLAVTTHIFERLKNSLGRIQEAFEEIGVDYFLTFYTVIDQQLSCEVEANIPKYFNTGNTSTYQLYLQVRDILQLSSYIKTRSKATKFHLASYHDWFTELVGDWIDVAAAKGTSEIRRAATSLDKVVTVTENVRFSHAALSAGASFKRIAAFWKNLQWPRAGECYAFVTRVVEKVAEAAEHFVHASHENLMKRKFYRTDSTKSFVASEQLCITLNDIEHVRQQLANIKEDLDIDHLISNLSQVEGDQQGVAARHSLDMLLDNANDNMKFHINQVISSVGEQISNDLVVLVKSLANSDPKISLVEALDPLMQYLSENMRVFHSSLLLPILEVMLEEVWIDVVHCFAQVSKGNLAKAQAHRLNDSFGELQSFFHAGGDGLPLNKIKTEEYKHTMELLDLLSMADDELILCHLRTLAKMARNGDKENGELYVSVGYIQDKQTLEVTVIRGSNLPALDSNGKSDPYVEVVLMPERKFKIKPVKTDYKNSELNPFYGKDFKIKVKEDFFNSSGAILAFSVYDHDFMSADDFAGMVAISCAEIPRLPTGSSGGLDDPNAPQRQNYTLPLIVDTTTPALNELAERHHQYVNDFNVYHKRNATIAGNIASTISSSIGRTFSLRKS